MEDLVHPGDISFFLLLILGCKADVSPWLHRFFDVSASSACFCHVVSFGVPHITTFSASTHSYIIQVFNIIITYANCNFCAGYDFTRATPQL